MDLFPELPSFALDAYFWKHPKRPRKILFGPDVREAATKSLMDTIGATGNAAAMKQAIHQGIEIQHFRGIPVGFMLAPGVAVVK